jgi:hypothetical protein
MAAIALSLSPAGTALAEDGARGTLQQAEGVLAGGNLVWEYRDLGDFRFNPRGEHVYVRDRFKDDWGILVELWWGGKLRRWCWNTKGANRGASHCDFNIKERQSITFFIAEAKKREWKKSDPSVGRGKRKDYWWGPNRKIPGSPPGMEYPLGNGDFVGTA